MQAHWMYIFFTMFIHGTMLFSKRCVCTQQFSCSFIIYHNYPEMIFLLDSTGLKCAIQYQATVLYMQLNGTQEVECNAANENRAEPLNVCMSHCNVKCGMCMSSGQSQLVVLSQSSCIIPPDIMVPKKQTAHSCSQMSEFN